MGFLTPQLFTACPDTELAFLLGPSPMRAVEVYSMTCKCSAADGGGSGSHQEQTNHAAAASRAVLRKLILATAAGPEGPASRGKQLSLWVPPYMNQL